MALRLTAVGRQAALNGGVTSLFAGAGNNFNAVFREGAVPADVDNVSANVVIVTFAAADEGASNVNGSYAPPSDDDTTAQAQLRNTISANAVSTYDYSDGGDGAGHVEIFVGTGRTAADKVADLTVGGPGTTGTQDVNWDNDDITNGGLVTLSSLNLTKT